jgi:hypothetical protein
MQKPGARAIDESRPEFVKTGRDNAKPAIPRSRPVRSFFNDQRA